MRFQTTVALLMLANSSLIFAQQPGEASPSGKALVTRGTGIEIVAKFSDQPTHIARTTDGRVFTVLFNALTGKSQLVEVLSNGTSPAYPDAAWNAGRKPDGTGFSDIIGLKAGGNGWLGIVDAGDAGYPPRVIIWDTTRNAPIKIKEVDAIRRQPGAQRFTQDIAIDVPHKCIYIVSSTADRRAATVIVLDIANDSVRPFTIWKDVKAEIAVAADKTELKDTASLRSGLSFPITIDPSGTWVYLSGIGGKDIFRIQSDVLASPDLNTDTLLKRLEKYGTKKTSTHMVADDRGNVYCAEGVTNAVGIFSPDRKYRTFVQDTILNYPYDLALSHDGEYLYISVNQIQRLNEHGNSTVNSKFPFLITRAKIVH